MLHRKFIFTHQTPACCVEESHTGKQRENFSLNAVVFFNGCGYFYAIGGKNDNSVEKYDIKENVWKIVAEMPIMKEDCRGFF